MHIGRSFSSAESPGIEDNATSKVVTIQSDGHIVPTANVTYDLGTSDLRFRDLYLSGSSLHLGAHEMTANATHVSMGNVVTTSVNATDTFTLTSSANTSSAGPDLILYRDSESPDDGDYLGQIQFKGKNDNNGDEIYAKVTGKISDASLSTEDGLIETAIKGAGSFTIVSRQKSNELQLLNGVGLSVAGDTTLSSNVTISETLTIAGDLVVNGNTTTIAANELKVEDSLIQLATNNEISDTVDIGFVGHYSNDGGTTALHTGFFRDASDEQYYLFNGYEDDTFDTATPPSTIDRTANTFSLAPLNVSLLRATGGSEPYVQITPDGSLGNAQIKFDGTDYTIVSNSSTANLKLATNSTTSVTINAAGDVGIGADGAFTSTNYKTLNVRGVNGGQILLGRDSNANHWDLAIYTAQYTASIAAPASTALRFLTNSSGSSNERMRITSDGNVAIGSNNAFAPLQINQTPPTAFGSPFLSVGYSTYTASGYYTMSFGYVNTAGSNAPAEIGLITTSDSSFTKGDLVFATRDVVTDTVPTERVRIKSSGRVGINRENPSAPLHVYEASPPSGVISKFEGGGGGTWLQLTSATTTSWQMGATTNGLEFYNDNNTSYLVAIDEGGNVGIGTRTPGSKLTITNTTAGEITLAADQDAFAGRQAAFNGRFFIGPHGNGYPEIGYNFRNKDNGALSQTYYSADTAWKITFGVGSRMSFMHATAGSTDASISWNNVMQVYSDNQVGIGNLSAASARLHVAGGDDWTFILDNDTTGGVPWYIGSSATSWNVGGGKFIISPSASSSSSALVIDGNGIVTLGVLAAGGATHQGKLRLGPNSVGGNATGGIEFLGSTYGSGYGWKMQTEDPGGGTPWVLYKRNNSNTWDTTPVIYARTQDSKVAFGTSTVETGSGAQITVNGGIAMTNSASFTSSTREVRGWYLYQGSGTSVQYIHLKTNLWAGGSPAGNTSYTMSHLRVKGYRYSTAAVGGGMFGFHNWNGTLYSISTHNDTSWSLIQSPYVSSDGYVVFVLYAGGSYVHAQIDMMQGHTYGWRAYTVTATTTSSSATGAY